MCSSIPADGAALDSTGFRRELLGGFRRGSRELLSAIGVLRAADPHAPTQFDTKNNYQTREVVPLRGNARQYWLAFI
jgi:hypothetical protein